MSTLPFVKSETDTPRNVAAKVQAEPEIDSPPKTGSPTAKAASFRRAATESTQRANTFRRAQTTNVAASNRPGNEEKTVPLRPGSAENKSPTNSPKRPESGRANAETNNAVNVLRPTSAEKNNAEKGKGKGFGPAPSERNAPGKGAPFRPAPSERNKPSFGPAASERNPAGPASTHPQDRGKAFGHTVSHTPSERKQRESMEFGQKKGATFGKASTEAGGKKRANASLGFSSARKGAPRHTTTSAVILEEEEESGGEATKGDGGNVGGAHATSPPAFGKAPTALSGDYHAAKRKTQVMEVKQVNPKEKIGFGAIYEEKKAKYSFLEAHPFFSGTREAFKAEVCRIIVKLPVKHDALLLEESVPVLNMKEGYVYLVDTQDAGASFELSLERQRIGTLTAGSVFGDAVAIGVVSTHVFSVRCNRADRKITDLFGIPIAKLDWALKKHPNDLVVLRQRALDVHARFLRLRALNSYEPQLVPGFEDVPLEFHTRIFQNSEIWLHRPGACMLREGDREEDMHAFLIWKGKVSCDVGGEVVNDLSSESWHGLTELLEITPSRAYTTTTRVDCICVKVQKKLFLNLMEDFSEETPLLNKIMFRTLDHLTQFSFRLDQLAMFSDCSQGVLLHLMAGADRKCFERGEKILHEGDENEDMYVVCRGTLAVQTEDGVRAQTLKAGDAYGDLAVLGIAQSNQNHHCLICVTICEVKVLTRAFFMSVLEANPGDRETFLQMHAAHGDDNRIAEEAIFDLPLFQVIDHECVSALMKVTIDVVSFPGTDIYRADEEGHSMFIIVRGVVEIFSPSLNKKFEMQGPNCIGEYALTSEEDGWRRTATVQAGTVCDLKELTRHDFLKTMDEYPGQRERFNEHVMNRMQLLEQEGLRQEKCTATARNQRKLRPAGTFIQRDGRGQSVSNTLFAKCSQDFLKEITMGIEKKMYYPGQEIIKEGDVGEYGVIVQVGQAVVEAQGTKVGELGPGSFVGEMAVLGFAERRVATVRATTLVLGLILHRDVIVSALECFPEEVKRFAEMANSRGQVLHAMIESDVEINTGIEFSDRVSKYRRFAQFLKKATIKAVYDPDMYSNVRCSQNTLNAYSRRKIKHFLRRRMDNLENAEVRRDVRLVQSGEMLDLVPGDLGYLSEDVGFGDSGFTHTFSFGASKDLDRASRVYTHRSESVPMRSAMPSAMRRSKQAVLPMVNRLITKVGGRLRGTAAIEFNPF